MYNTVYQFLNLYTLCVILFVSYTSIKLKKRKICSHYLQDLTLLSKEMFIHYEYKPMCLDGYKRIKQNGNLRSSFPLKWKIWHFVCHWINCETFCRPWGCAFYDAAVRSCHDWLFEIVDLTYFKYIWIFVPYRMRA